jgi:hypothetical protein
MHHLIGKSFAIVMVPLSIIILLEQIGVYALQLPFDKLLVGAILMIALEIITLIGVIINYKKPSITNMIAVVAFLTPPLIYLGHLFIGYANPSYIPLIMAVTMFGETIYATGI